MTKRLSKAEILAQIPAARARVEARHAVGLYAKSVRYEARFAFRGLDTDYSVPGLALAIGAQESGRRGGRVRSEAKAQSSKANGAKGGRPRKVASAQK